MEMLTFNASSKHFSLQKANYLQLKQGEITKLVFRPCGFLAGIFIGDVYTKGFIYCCIFFTVFSVDIVLNFLKANISQNTIKIVI